MGQGPHVGIERLSGVQMLPPKNFYPKVLEGGQGDFFQEVPLVLLVPFQTTICRDVYTVMAYSLRILYGFGQA